MSHVHASQSLGEIVAVVPMAADVFKKYKIDFCCGGHRSLADALQELGLDEKPVLKKLDEVYEQTLKLTSQVDFRSMASTDLIDYIINKHHVFLKKTLPEISELATTILRVHGPNHTDLFQVHKLFHMLKTDLDQHLIKEEGILFPMIKEYALAPSDANLAKIRAQVVETEDEHVAAGGVLKDLRNLTQDYQVPADGCTTYRKTFKKLQEFESDLFQHIHLENNILFKQIGLQDA